MRNSIWGSEGYLVEHAVVVGVEHAEDFVEGFEVGHVRLEDVVRDDESEGLVLDDGQTHAVLVEDPLFASAEHFVLLHELLLFLHSAHDLERVLFAVQVLDDRRDLLGRDEALDDPVDVFVYLLLGGVRGVSVDVHLRQRALP